MRRFAARILTDRVIGVLAMGALGTVIVLLASSVVVWVGHDLAELPVTFESGAIGTLGLIFSAVCYTTVGALLLARGSRNPTAWLFLVIGLVLATMFPINLLVSTALETLRPAPPALVALAWLRSAVATPGVITLLIVTGCTFPDGRVRSRASRFGVIAAVVGGLGLMASTGLARSGLVIYPWIANPFAAPAVLEPFVTAGRLLSVWLLGLAVALALASVAERYRRGDVVVRAQLRWILGAVVMAAVGGVPFLLTRYVFPVSGAVGEIATMVAQLTSAAFPVAAVLAITRYHLYDVDLLIGRTLVYLPLTAILGGLYTFAIAFFQRVFVAVTGERSDLALLLTVLLVASAFTPVRRALEAAVERRYGRRVEAQRAANAAVGASLEAGAAIEADAKPAETEASRSGGVPVRLASLLKIGADGLVDCPRRRTRVSVATCLPCPAFSAFVPGREGGIVCSATPAADAP
ncbi:MAG TPA: hypothetical protein VFS32_01955 [Candidatus Limnocylindrales bacterium]|nr:hypothetical protein [Candidatus Limnocylindrales bacterium]